jgi:hypothetical protein
MAENQDITYLMVDNDELRHTNIHLKREFVEAKKRIRELKLHENQHVTSGQLNGHQQLQGAVLHDQPQTGAPLPQHTSEFESEVAPDTLQSHPRLDRRVLIEVLYPEDDNNHSKAYKDEIDRLKTGLSEAETRHKAETKQKMDAWRTEYACIRLELERAKIMAIGTRFVSPLTRKKPKLG